MIYGKNRNQLLIILLVVGFFIGIFYENMVGSIQLFQTEKLKLFVSSSLGYQEYLLHICKNRMIFLACMCFLWNFKWRRVVILFFNNCCGFFWGRMIVSAILFQGIKGIVIFVCLLFPHMLLYGFAYLMLILHLYNNRRKQWNRTKTIVFFIAFLLGLWCEVYVNPRIVKWIIGWI